MTGIIDEVETLLHVKVSNPEDIAKAVITTQGYSPQHFGFETFVVGPGFTDILQEDPMRQDALILSADAPAVLCHSGNQANSTRNQVVGLPNPDGFYMPAGLGIVITGTSKVWIAAPVQTRISVAINRVDRRPNND